MLGHVAFQGLFLGLFPGLFRHQCKCDHEFAREVLALEASSWSAAAPNRVHPVPHHKLPALPALDGMNLSYAPTVWPESGPAWPARPERRSHPAAVQAWNRTQSGVNPVCGVPEVFTLPRSCAPSERRTSCHSDLRNQHVSANCRTIPRIRALAFAVQALLPQWQSARVHESSPNWDDPFTRRLTSVLGSNYTMSQYSHGTPCGGQLKGGVGGRAVSLNLEAQHCVPDESFDLVITQDVFEHVYDGPAAFREIERTLRPGGVHVFTVPLLAQANPTWRPATRSPDGVVLHSVPAVHGLLCPAAVAAAALLTRSAALPLSVTHSPTLPLSPSPSLSLSLSHSLSLHLPDCPESSLCGQATRCRGAAPSLRRTGDTASAT